MNGILLFPIRIVVLVLFSFLLLTDEKQHWVELARVTFGTRPRLSKRPDGISRYRREVLGGFCRSPEEKTKRDNVNVLTWLKLEEGKQERSYADKLLSVQDWAATHSANYRPVRSKNTKDARLETHPLPAPKITPFIPSCTHVSTMDSHDLSMLERFGCLTDLEGY